MNPPYEQLLNAAACGLLVVQKNEAGATICLAGNAAAEQLLGQSSLAGKSWSDLTGTIGLPLFQEEIVSLPNASVCRVIKRDLSPTEQLYTLLDISAERRSKKELEEFSYIASHDLQEPLRKISSFGERIDRNRATLTPETALYLSRMLNATQRMQSMLNGLLLYSRITHIDEVFVPVNLKTIVNDAFNKELNSYGLLPVRFTVDELPEIEGIPQYLLLLFEQLFSNSLKFVRKATTPEITVTSDIQLPNRQLILRVQDNGIGFESENAERIFSLFHRLHGRSEFEGAGIGLALCRKIVEKHSGTITAHGIPEKGTLFRITLPLSQPVLPKP